MSVKLTTRQVGDVTVIDVAGRITLGEGSSTLRDALRDMVSKNQKKILLNLGEVSYIDSSGIATLLEVLKDSQRLKKEFVLFGLSPAVEDVFRLTHVIRIFQVLQTEQEALGIA